jgi:DsbC/DsbD-like thiol-disulfide interchange protein
MFASRQHCRIVIFALCLVGALLGNSRVSASDASKKVRAFATAGKIDKAGMQTVTITLMIDSGWHIYANPPQNKKYDGSKTEVKLRNTSSVKYDVRYPVGTFSTGKYNLRCMVYQESVDIVAVVQRAPGDASPVDIDVTFCACNDDTCYAPVTLRGRPGDEFLPVPPK